ncbi:MULTISPECIES: DUF2768 domain-containing protein [Bacillus]|uniref:NAD(FAD)-dependent dehydrogenase n=2 Tax=Bacillus TaxID=1386 RepID=A0A0M5J9Y0_9BACI|nr:MULTISPECIES: DUF2768 domain-containing protein [Bacillus]ALC81427.1 hypothetical protein AM592_07320 [Bacillus gobiensis]MBP1080460.1 small-conductance mechanosensitive channel [Bacillus capparidis]MED1094317.1 DUF2768 domain-containing protein [Bacillus capparidis]
MSIGLLKMWFALASMGLMAVAVLSIYLSRYKFNNRYLKFFVSGLAYICMILSGIIVFFVVFSGPVQE